MKKIKLYHGANHTKIENIKSEGLKGELNDPNWFTLSDNFGSALYHASQDEDGFAYVFEIELELEDYTNDGFFWNGYPQLWNGHKNEKDGYTWYALMDSIDKSYLRKIHKVTPESFSKQQQNKYKDLDLYERSISNIKSKNKNKYKKP